MTGLMTKISDSQVIIRDAETNERMKTGSYEGKFWWLKFVLPLVESSENERTKVLQDLTLIRRSYQSGKKRCANLTNEEKGGSKEVVKMQTLQDTFPENTGQMSENDLNAIDETRVKSLRECEGLLWHLRLNHASKGYLQIAAKVIPEIKQVRFIPEILDCEACKLAKAKRKPYLKERTRAEEPLQQIHSDLMGPIKPCSY